MWQDETEIIFAPGKYVDTMAKLNACMHGTHSFWGGGQPRNGRNVAGGKRSVNRAP